MRNQTPIVIAAVVMLFAPWAGGLAVAPQNPCAESLSQEIPQRAANAPGGRAFAQQISSVSDDERESLIREQLTQCPGGSALGPSAAARRAANAFDRLFAASQRTGRRAAYGARCVAWGADRRRQKKTW